MKQTKQIYERIIFWAKEEASAKVLRQKDAWLKGWWGGPCVWRRADKVKDEKKTHDGHFYRDLQALQ